MNPLEGHLGAKTLHLEELCSIRQILDWGGVLLCASTVAAYLQELPSVSCEGDVWSPNDMDVTKVDCSDCQDEEQGNEESVLNHYDTTLWFLLD